jgi:hypothetical protein
MIAAAAAIVVTIVSVRQPVEISRSGAMTKEVVRQQHRTMPLEVQVLVPVPGCAISPMPPQLSTKLGSAGRPADAVSRVQRGCVTWHVGGWRSRSAVVIGDCAADLTGAPSRSAAPLYVHDANSIRP